MGETKTDRYLTFKGIDGDDNAKRVVSMLRSHIDDPEKTNAFWDMFKEKLAMAADPSPNSGRRLDELFLVHSYLNNIREFFEEYEDHAALALLDQVEMESC